MHVCVCVREVIEVASAAKRAMDQSTEADRRCAELSQLLERATEQAACVRHVAANLTETAASVARLALDVCRYDSLEQAFRLATTDRPASIDVDTFLSVVDTQRGNVGHCQHDQSTKTTDDTVDNDCPSSSFHSVSVPAMYAYHYLCQAVLSACQQCI